MEAVSSCSQFLMKFRFSDQKIAKKNKEKKNFTISTTITATAATVAAAMKTSSVELII